MTLYEDFSMFPPCEFFFSFFTWEFYHTQLSRQENLGFFPRVAARLYLRLDYIAGRSRGLFARTGHDF